MGNAQSGPAETGGGGGEAPRRPKKLVKPPTDWQDGDEFVMISPLSDLSNPSQFRHRLKDGKHPVAKKSRQPVKPRNNVRQTQRRPNTVPPKGFYFENPEGKQETIVPQADAANPKWIAAKQAAAKKKARRAKKFLQGCLNDNHAAICTREKPAVHQRLPSFSSAHQNQRKSIPTKSDTIPVETLKEEGAQFVVPPHHPTVKFNPLLEVKSSPSNVEEESHIDIIKPYIHDESLYVDRIVDPSKRPSETPLEAKGSGSNSATESTQNDNENVDPLVIRLHEIQPHTPQERRSESKQNEAPEPTILEPSVCSSLYHDNDQGEIHNILPSAEDEISSIGKPDGEQSRDIFLRLDPNSIIKKVSEPYPEPVENGEQQFAEQALRVSGESDASLAISKSTAPRASQDRQQERQRVLKSAMHKSDIRKAAQILERGSTEAQPTTETSTETSSMDRREEDVKKSEESVGNYLAGSTMTQMLLQTYRIVDSDPAKGAHSEVSMTPEHKGTRLLEASPAPSVDSVNTPMSTASKPMVSHQAIQNATFLFSPSYADGDQDLLRLPAPHKGATPFAITTTDARSRLGSHPRPDPSEYGLDSVVSETSTRRVRFSDPEDPVESPVPTLKKTTQLDEIQVQPMSRNWSDLTEMTGDGRESLVSVANSHHPSVTPIPKESFEEPLLQTGIEDEEYSTEEYPTNWYNNMDNGVTPLRSGKSVNNATHSPFIRFKAAKKKFSGDASDVQETQPEPVRKPRESGGLVHSLTRRIEEATLNFEKSNEEMKKNRRDTAGHEVIAPRKASLVSRHFATGKPTDSLLEDQEDEDSMIYPWETSSKATFSIHHDQKLDIVSGSPWVAPNTTSNGYEADQSRTGSLSTSGNDDKQVRIQQFDASPSMLEAADGASTQSLRYSVASGQVRFELDDNEEVREPAATKDARDSLSAASDIQRTSASSSSEMTRNYQSEMDTTVDDFAMLLKEEEEGSDDEETFTGEAYEDFDGEETVSTIRQHVSSVSEIDRLVSKDNLYSASEDENTADNATVSTFETMSESVATVRQQRDTVAGDGNSNLSSVLAETPVLPFRESSAVRPNEQFHRVVPGAGSLHLSPMQRTPMQARKWRELATSANGKGSAPFGKNSAKPHRKSLAERNPNVQ